MDNKAEDVKQEAREDLLQEAVNKVTHEMMSLVVELPENVVMALMLSVIMSSIASGRLCPECFRNNLNGQIDRFIDIDTETHNYSFNGGQRHEPKH